MTEQHKTPAVILDADFRSQSGIIQPLGRHGIPIVALSSKRDCPAFHSKYVQAHFETAAIDDGEEAYIQSILALPVRGVLFYSNDPGALCVAKHQERLREAGFLLNVADADTMHTVFDKWACYQLATRLGIPMAKTMLVRSADEARSCWREFTKPVILKGTTLAGGMYRRIERIEQIEEAWNWLQGIIRHPDYTARKSRVIMQEWISYPMTDIWSCETLYLQDGAPSGFFTIRRIRCSINDDGTYSSRLFAGHYEKNDTIIEHTQKILDAMNYRGFAHVEYFFVRERNQFFLTEVNPRLPGYSYYPCTAGFDMAQQYYEDVLGQRKMRILEKFPTSLYHETLHHPGDITQGIIRIAKRQATITDYLKSYSGYIGNRYTVKIVDPVRKDDLKFSYRFIKDDMTGLTRQISKKIMRILRKLAKSPS